ncbi:MAG: VacJ family lipoprotein [Sulfurifustaceae bacterium]
MNRLLRALAPLRSALFGVLVTFLAAGCATTTRDAPTDAGRAPDSKEDFQSTNDPLEPINRAIYTFNDKLDRYLLKPVAKGYRAVIPGPVRRSVSNFFSNLHEPAVIVNNALQGRFGDAGSEVGRFVTNSTIGVFGLFDVASPYGLERHTADFGQTLGKWGVGDGWYLVLPLFGPSNVRDGIGLYGDFQLYPPTYMEEQSTAWKLYAVEVVSIRDRLLDAGDILEQAGGEDPYVFVREAYRQRRRTLIKGEQAAPAPSTVDPSIFEEDKPTPAAPKKPPEQGSGEPAKPPSDTSRPPS